MKFFVILIVVGVVVALYYNFISGRGSGISDNPRTVTGTESIDEPNNQDHSTSRGMQVSESISLPLPGSAPTTNVKHIIPIEEIRQGCFRQDCIPSVDTPEFITVAEAQSLISSDSIGIALSYKGINRFYPFPMLETHEIVNDVVAGDPLLVTYCPLCGTGIVFDRNIEGEAVEFGVSGMLWQSNLLMYNRAEDLRNRNLWSQVLGQAVVGDSAGEQMVVVPSDVMKFGSWSSLYKEGSVLNTGSTRDPYKGEYFRVADSFNPNYNEEESLLPPMTYVYGIEIDTMYKAYPRDTLMVGVTKDVLNGTTVTITKTENGIVTFSAEGNPIPDIEGFWFSWVSAHPETLLWNN